MRHKSTLVLGLTVLALLGLIAAGCGGGGKKEAAATTTEAATTEAATTEAVTTEAVATEAATTTTSNLGGLTSTKNCRELGDLGQKFSSAFTGAANSQDLKTEAKLLK